MGYDADTTLANDAGVAGRAPGPHRAHGRARQEPPVGHHLVAGQRGRRRRRTSRPPRRGSTSATRRGPSTTSGPEHGAHTDIVCPMYPRIRRIAGRTPASRTTGRSSCASTRTPWATARQHQDYWDVIYDSPSLQGGFIWDWVDQGSWCARTRRERERTDVTARDYLPNGVRLRRGLPGWPAWRATAMPHPQLWEVKKVYQPVRDAGRWTLVRGPVAVCAEPSSSSAISRAYEAHGTFMRRRRANELARRPCPR